MKRYIHANTEVFDRSSTGMSYYDNFLNEKDLAYMQKAKNRTGHIEMMSPNEYFERCSKDIFETHPSVERLKQERGLSKFRDGGDRFVDRYQQAMKNGDKFPICMLDYAGGGQEGLHRMYSAGEAFGWDTKFPVLVVEPFDKDEYNKKAKWGEINDYIYYDLNDIIDTAKDNISDWKSYVPFDFEEKFKREIEEQAKLYEDPHDIRVICKIQDNDPNKVYIFFENYDGIDFAPSSPVREIWLDDMFKVEDDVDDSDYVDEEDDILEDEY